MDAGSIEQSERLGQDKRLAELVRSRSDSLAAIVVDATARARWDLLADDRGRPLLVLRLENDSGGESTREFAPDELQPRFDSHFRSRLSEMALALPRIGRWREQVASLYANIRTWAGKIKPPVMIVEGSVRLDERMSGPYEIASMRIRRGDSGVDVRPVATWVVGADGRVDLVGPAGREILVVRGDSWHRVPDDYRLQQILLNEQTFDSAVEELLA